MILYFVSCLFMFTYCLLHGRQHEGREIFDFITRNMLVEENFVIIALQYRPTKALFGKHDAAVVLCLMPIV